MAFSLSDANVTETSAQIVSKRRRYSDLDLSLYHSTSTKNDIVPLTDIDAIKNSVRNILLSNKYDRPFQPYLGAGLRNFLFEPADQFTKFAIKQNITHALVKYEPRINGISVNVQYEEGEDRFVIVVTFNVIALAKRTDMRLFLTRIR